MQPLWFVPIAAILAIASKIPTVVAMNREGSGYDNHQPREQQSRLTGWGRRALAAHQNTMESFPLFAAGMLTGAVLQADAALLTACGAIFIVARIVYIYLYIADIATLRSIVWGVGFAASLASACFGLSR
jgi:uncharacterized MAPEG superfamily protein